MSDTALLYSTFLYFNVRYLVVLSKRYKRKTLYYFKVLSRGKGFKENKSDEVGRAIVTFFPEIECKTLPIPHSDAKVMQDIANHTDDLNPLFQEGIVQFMEHLVTKVHVNGPKRGYQKGSVMTGDLSSALLS